VHALQFENTINKAVADLNAAVASLNLIKTLEVQQQLQQLVLAASASQVGLAQELEQAHQQDLKQLQGHLEQLLGGQAELQQQLAAATQEQRQEWATVAGHLGQLAGDVRLIRGDVGVVMDEVRELADAVRAWAEGRTPLQASGSGQLVRSRLMLDREQVQWDMHVPLAQGGFANVYNGYFAGEAVAVKLLRLSAFAEEQQREQVRDTAMVATGRPAAVCTLSMPNSGAKQASYTAGQPVGTKPIDRGQQR
jgi:hypothetical protein